ncbi:LOW QUALITY PROTEIN: interferon lambda-3-like [Camarhynchus parvulus]|uniref:LOW QUALITY PROTEIN: interferon lambda-3-like n=1 Tax=Geospiza parvula TaxID=87175 RepID=UPI001237ACAF|nr:LOW QUALITY PROTEIN: interferon lambda-3-like [Camarhynchus parvulus]
MLRLSLAPLLVLVLGVSLGAAFPHDTLGKGCRLSQYQSIAPEQQLAVDRMRQEFVTTHKCNTKLFHRKWNAVNLPMSDRVLLVAAELNLTTAMLGLPAAPSFAELCRESLHFFRTAREAVQGCVDPSHQPSGRLRHWLHKLQNAMRAVSQAGGVLQAFGVKSRCCRADPAHLTPQESPESRECLRATTILHVLQVLDNLRCAALQDKC